MSAIGLGTELHALSACCDALAVLTPSERKRVLIYLGSRFDRDDTMTNAYACMATVLDDLKAKRDELEAKLTERRSEAARTGPKP